MKWLKNEVRVSSFYDSRRIRDTLIQLFSRYRLGLRISKCSRQQAVGALIPWWILTFSLTTVLSHLTTLYFPQVVRSRRKLHSISHFWRNRSVVLSNADEPVRQQIINSRNIRHDTCATFERPILQGRSVSSGLPHFIVQAEDFDSALFSNRCTMTTGSYLIAGCTDARLSFASSVHVSMIDHGNATRKMRRVSARDSACY